VAASRVRPQAGADRQDRAQPRRSRSSRTILRASDGIMVARGDLAVEVGNAAVPALAKAHDQAWRASTDKVVITATQMMESHDHQPGAHPRRGERRGQCGAGRHRRGDAVSAETAAGKYPLETVVRDGQDLPRGRSVPTSMSSWMPTSPARPSAASTSPSPWARCSPRTTWAAKAIVAHDRVAARPRCG